MKSFVVLGLGYGDEGKGSWTDALCREYNASLVIRFCGGAQAGHRVELADGRSHIFSQFGSGTFTGASTLLSRYMIVNPITMFPEAKHLTEVGISNPWERMIIERDALVTTPFHVAANRLFELFRDTNRHGSCGMGVGETMNDWLKNTDDCVFIRDLEDSCSNDVLWKLRAAQDRMLKFTSDLREHVNRTHPSIARELSVLEGKDTIRQIYDYFATFRELVTIVDPHWLSRQTKKHETIVFEGAQGVLLDQDFGFQPYTTWTNCTFGNANKLLEGISGEVIRLGLVRSYMTRHGAGPFVSEDTRFDECSKGDHNMAGNDWQKGFRSGGFDQVATGYALDAVGGIDGLVVSHMDRLFAAQRELSTVPVCVGYDVPMDVGSRDYERQKALATKLMGAKPVFEEVPKVDYAQTMADRMGVPLYATSYGPTADGKTIEKRAHT